MTTTIRLKSAPHKYGAYLTVDNDHAGHVLLFIVSVNNIDIYVCGNKNGITYICYGELCGCCGASHDTFNPWILIKLYRYLTNDTNRLVLHTDVDVYPNMKIYSISEINITSSALDLKQLENYIIDARSAS